MSSWSSCLENIKVSEFFAALCVCVCVCMCILGAVGVVDADVGAE